MGPVCARTDSVPLNHMTNRLLALVIVTAAVVTGAADWLWQPGGAVPSSQCPAYFESGNPPRLTLFPIEGPEMPVSLRAAVPTNLRIVRFSPDGKAIYGQRTEPLNRSIGIDKIEFQPTRDSLIPGSIGTGELSCLTVSQTSGRIIAAGWSWTHNQGGIFEIAPGTATSRPLAAGSPSLCGGPGGLLSPDEKQAVVKAGKQLGLLNVETRAARTLKGTSVDMQCAWSPNGQWIAGVRNGQITLIGAEENTPGPRNLGASGDGPVQWSPDSKFLLLRKSQLSCIPSLYGESLEVIDVETGKRTPIRSTHCRILSGAYGWIDRDVIAKTR